MGGLKINTGGGGLVIGAGGVATGVGGNVVFNASPQDQQLSKADLVTLLAGLGALKAALVGADVAGASAWATRVAGLEQSLLESGGRLPTAQARQLLAKIRYAAREDAPVRGALKAATPLLRQRTQPADVFITYKREDRDRAQIIVDALRTLGADVWIDDQLTPGASFSDEIYEEIEFCRAQIVCWSPAAAASDWVRGEAEIGRQRGVLICVTLEPCQVRPPFNVLHSEDLSGWRGEATHAGWRKVLETLAARLDRPALAKGGGHV